MHEAQSASAHQPTPAQILRGAFQEARAAAAEAWSLAEVIQCLNRTETVALLELELSQHPATTQP